MELGRFADKVASMVSNHEQRVLLIVHQLDPDCSMESRLSWFRVLHAASVYPTTVVCAHVTPNCQYRLSDMAPRTRVLELPHFRFENFLIRFGLFYLAYRLWHHRVLRSVQSIHRRQPFSLVHQVSFCGYREPGECWKLGVPFVWGPLGGTQNLPWNFLWQLGFPSVLGEFFRNIVNSFQLRFSLRVRRAMRTASLAFAANRAVQRSILHTHGRELPVQLETGIDKISSTPRKLRVAKAPLKILWAGRLESWKGLPLLLKALAQLPAEVAVEVRILGNGKLANSFRKLSDSLGLSEKITWEGWPPYTSRDTYYEWADVLAFTSLRDTSGTGLLEALAAGVPIVGLDHQGAHDIMTPECAVAIPVENPVQVAADFSKAIANISQDSHLLLMRSRCARERAQHYLWEGIGERMLAEYDLVLAKMPISSAVVSRDPSIFDIPPRHAQTVAFRGEP